MSEESERVLFEALVARAGLNFEPGREEMMFTVARQIFAWSDAVRPAPSAEVEPATAYAPATVAPEVGG
ncbi:MAG: hypothetical protein AAGI50_00745 [Pseudomonadota bacterium]